MMRLLLDTHIWLWVTLEPHKLSSEVNRLLAAPQNTRFLSPVSLWEAIILLEKKKIEVDKDLGNGLNSHETIWTSKKLLSTGEWSRNYDS